MDKGIFEFGEKFNVHSLWPENWVEENTYRNFGKRNVSEENKQNSNANKYNINETQLKSISPNTANTTLEKHLDGINLALEENKINSCIRAAHFLSQALHESGGLKYTKEGGVNDSDYGGYIGRGLFQITGKTNYHRYQDFSGEDVTSSLENKAKLEKPPHAAQSAGWFWNLKRLNELADQDDFIMITRKINGGFNGFDDRLKFLNTALKELCNRSAIRYRLSSSSAYNDNRACFAWGLWHDPGINDRFLNTCTNDKQKAINGYSRFISLTSDKYLKTNWYRIKTMDEFSNLKQYDSKNRPYVLVRSAAIQRLKELRNE